MLANSEIKKENAKYFIDIAGNILNCMGSKNLSDLEEIFFCEFNSIASPQIQSSMITILHKIKIQIFSIDHVDAIFSILTECSKIMLKTKEKDLKINTISVISEILLNFSDVAKTELNVPSVKNFIESLVPFSSEMLKKYKYSQYSIRLATSILCCSIKKNFFANYFSMITNLFTFLKVI
ncbi:Protein furry [Thelohanellus kitauei]|uniref:Protein furry n=1 Tax=Thelohanellus kitauei TaxID=669202 RepID=A0A0C2NED6_THEKT|nr:Protein furry [Thelohanellus kitauei]